MNQRFDENLDDLHQRLSFLSEAERDAELTELRSHLEERFLAYERSGDTPEKALQATLEKWGEPRQIVFALRRRWLVRKLDHPIAIALILLVSGQFLSYFLNSQLYALYRLYDPTEYLGVIQHFPVFPGCTAIPPHQSGVPYQFLMLAIQVFVAVSTSLAVARVGFKSLRHGVALYAIVYASLVLWLKLQYLDGMRFNAWSPNRFLLEPSLLITQAFFWIELAFAQTYYLLIVVFVTRRSTRLEPSRFWRRAR